MYRKDYELRINSEAEPPDWAYLQSIQYYFDVIVPARNADFGNDVLPPFSRDDWIHETFICAMICEQISRVGKARSKGSSSIAPTEDFQPRGLWASYYRYVLEHIKILNMCIRDEGRYGGRNRVFYCIARLMYFDMVADASSCHAHINGFFTYVQRIGGAKAVLSLPVPPIQSFRAVLTVGAMANTTSPASQQIPGPGQLTDDEIASIYDWTFLSNLPCPSELFLCIIHLTRLRVRVFSGQPAAHATALKVRIHNLFDKICTLDFDIWVREASTASDNALDVAEAFRHATLLYGIVALPRRAVASWARHHHGTTDDDAVVYARVRSAQQRALLGVMRRMAPRVKCRCCITWPLVVAGVAASDGRVPGVRAFVEESFLAMADEPAEGGFALPSLQRLRVLWRSGRTGWDDAFPRPCIAVQ
ncbi:C6 zinc finger domain protein [Akanthomyces lecanii RCEF 1005]|uniref:C6 zinc finger domain protein n=1 Tax=Akanthomyces lecanii RCEF 1005 TaxID=1081108 RepID=A0A162KAP2_CORDF|nr:C6 zinc finger domain protein [Akanthomyces lecanii RCEF 1005]